MDMKDVNERTGAAIQRSSRRDCSRCVKHIQALFARLWSEEAHNV